MADPRYSTDGLKGTKMTFIFLKKLNLEKIKMVLKKKFLFLLSFATLGASLVAFVLGQIALSLFIFVLLIVYYAFYIFKAKTHSQKTELKLTKKSLIVSATAALIFGLLNFYPLKEGERNALLFFSFMIFIFAFLIIKIIKNYQKNKSIIQKIAFFESQSLKNDKK